MTPQQRRDAIALVARRLHLETSCCWDKAHALATTVLDDVQRALDAPRGDARS